MYVCWAQKKPRYYPLDREPLAVCPLRSDQRSCTAAPAPPSPACSRAACGLYYGCVLWDSSCHVYSCLCGQPACVPPVQCSVNMPTKVVSKPAALPELPVGHVLGKWTLGKRLGAGGFGYVHEATHPALPGQVFALKVAVLKEASRGSKPAKDTHGAVMIHKEVNTYRNVVGRHASRHFARLAPRDAYEENAQYRWLVMDKLGASLAEKAATKKVPFSTVANIGLQVVCVRARVHTRTRMCVSFGTTAGARATCSAV